MSDLQKMAFGMGFTQLDEKLRPFKDYFNRSLLKLEGKGLPEGVFMFGRIRAFNNGRSFFLFSGFSHRKWSFT